ncbi:energy transducer TonB [Agaribacterium haliotis]|uniref:energy transducer TonB n=1 Tax=Agaribacterium haliotis TaxID=2013869 RepID=UPI001EFCCCCA|nr:energy transducer TonB [Agaribacterium haliotis]
MLRIISSAIPAVIVTMGLLLTMHLLIASNMTEPKEVEEFKIPEITMDNREVSEEFDTAKVEKPEEVEEPPPEIPEPEFEAPDIDNSIAIAPEVGVKVNIGAVGGFSSDGDYLPIVKVAPKYPARAASRGVEGYCTVKYTVTTTGETKDIVEADCPNRIFLSASIKAAKKFKYKPKVIDGQAIEVPNVHNRFTYKLAE